ncbi:MAG: hypothetical protein A2Y03_10355 [Omnitrophica WOR_2 bacterium GWF2_38_59]|nr:MAG: hypothetical protein A2Y06_07565 [Omnitrophica WOR_2 bacterium GWA2_37_7]OGX24099.1 MAG: hypothetical protein A2Y03_10355 [Omnitrophica WOR_2 bacterium GWF2_38_59]OGX50718.1 MAG: hypothetical protein A2267_08325 [Omnitrophica WOR_2 bacterium RIFOXYA12_FULL_38_10]OGX51324.1 MAG: hypothetical protein A2243_09895 [Omnitrophica WOR_2 bacterium RIFOXYA2_FULL_38_17]OGX54975.1 MAG: hypothetical protein A2447_10770 [Omnitrophica WOR_2 bacterium RIFOXYC2_FULL_38_12]OGX55725.1 MAG: hypothetical 
MNKIRETIYLIFLVVPVFFVISKQMVIKADRNSEILSTFSEWQKNGKPVIVHTIERKDIPKYIKITAWQISPHVFEGNVSKSVRDQLKVGQDMAFKVGQDMFKGEISKIAQEISLDSGMYAVEVTFKESFNIEGWLVAQAHIDTFRNSICIPNEIIENDSGKSYVWKIKDGRSVKQVITVEKRDGYGAIVDSGLVEGDSVVIEGFTQLVPGDKVNILKGLNI